MQWRDDTTLPWRGLWLGPIGKSYECSRRPFRVKMRRTRIEHILSALPPLATEERTFGIGSSVPKADSCAAAEITFVHLVAASEQPSRWKAKQRP